MLLYEAVPNRPEQIYSLKRAEAERSFGPEFNGANQEINVLRQRVYCVANMSTVGKHNTCPVAKPMVKIRRPVVD